MTEILFFFPCKRLPFVRFLWYNQLMTDLEKTILQKASGETRLNPDEQRLYMGTFRERVVLILAFSEVSQAHVQEKFDTICQQLSQQYNPLTLKLSPNLSDSLQIQLMKTAQTHAITTSIVDEKLAASPHALVFHTDHAVDRKAISLAATFPALLETPTSELPKKKGFWQNLFGG